MNMAKSGAKIDSEASSSSTEGGTGKCEVRLKTEHRKKQEQEMKGN